MFSFKAVDYGMANLFSQEFLRIISFLTPFHIKFMEKHLVENKGSTLISSLRDEFLFLCSISSSDFLYWLIGS